MAKARGTDVYAREITSAIDNINRRITRNPTGPKGSRRKYQGAETQHSRDPQVFWT
jgi:hypothetical protein